MGAPGFDETRAIVADPKGDGHVWFGGTFWGYTFTFGYGTGVNKKLTYNSNGALGTTADGFLGRYNRNNYSVSYLQAWGNPQGSESIYSMVVDNSSYLYVLGTFCSVYFNVGGWSLTNVNLNFMPQVFLVKVKPDNPAYASWSKQFDCDSWDQLP